MSRKAQQSNKWNFKVIQEKISRKGKDTGFIGNFREDTGECLGMVTDNYGVIQNADLIEAAKAALAARGLKGYKESIIVAGKGERMYGTYTFEDKTLKNEVGDIFGYRLRIHNSFDRSLRGSIALGFLRLICSNGCSTLEHEFNVTKKHSSKVTVDFVGDAIDKAMDHGRTALAVFDTLATIKISDEQGKNILAHLEKNNIISGKLREEITLLWLAPKRKQDRARTLYNLYNAVTEHLTHKVEGERFEYADKVNSSVLLRLHNAARKPDTLAKLIVPVPEGVSVKVDAQPIADATGAETTLVTR
jgi:hypothetical protein